MWYGSECWAVDKKIERRTGVAEVRMLRMDEWGDERK